MSTPQFSQEELCFFMSPEENIYSSGQPDEAAINKLKAFDFSTIINLRPDSEMQGSQQAQWIENADMQYIVLPITGPDDITFANAERLHGLLTQAHGKVLIHCATGNRVGALLALCAAQYKNLPTEQAIAYGKAGGLSKLEDKVRAMLSHA